MKITLKKAAPATAVAVMTTDNTAYTEIKNELLTIGLKSSQITATDDIKGAESGDNIDLVMIDTRQEINFTETLRSELERLAFGAELLILTDKSSTTELSTEMDFLRWPDDSARLVTTVKRALEHRRTRHELMRLKQQIAMSYGYDNLVGDSAVMGQIRETATRVAPTDIPLMLNGPEGTGKELLARTIHHHSKRRSNPFVMIDCAAIPEALIETELLSVNEDQKPGAVMQAEGGTMYLANVDQMPPAAQASLLRLFQYGEIISPDGQTAKVDVRVISASNESHADLSRSGSIREDLLGHLSVIKIELPALIQRHEDIEALADGFTRQYSFENKLGHIGFTRGALELLMNHTWPGNVQELQNVVNRAASLCQDNQIDADDILIFGSKTAGRINVSIDNGPSAAESEGLLADSQRSVILNALSDNNWNFTRTAQALGIGRTTLWRKVKKYNLQRDMEVVAD